MKRFSLKKPIKGIVFLMLPFFILVSCTSRRNNPTSLLKFGMSFSANLSPQPLDGRMLLLVSNDESREPRFQINDGPDTQLIFGINIDQLAPGEPAFIDGTTFGYPLQSIADIPAGDYWVQGPFEPL